MTVVSVNVVYTLKQEVLRVVFIRSASLPGLQDPTSDTIVSYIPGVEWVLKLWHLNSVFTVVFGFFCIL